MLSSKDRAALRSQANSAETILHIGKSGVTEAVVAQAREALAARELVKGKVLESAGMTAREVCDALCQALGAEPVQTIGTVSYTHLDVYKRQPVKFIGVGEQIDDLMPFDADSFVQALI